MINREELIELAGSFLTRRLNGLPIESQIALAAARVALARELRESRAERNAENSKTGQHAVELKAAISAPERYAPSGMTFPPNPNGFIMRLEGPTGTGKSTLVAGLRDAGYEVTRMKHLHDAELYHVIPPPRTL